jgi:hypothetical protein
MPKNASRFSQFVAILIGIAIFMPTLARNSWQIFQQGIIKKAWLCIAQLNDSCMVTLCSNLNSQKRVPNFGHNLFSKIFLIYLAQEYTIAEF